MSGEFMTVFEKMQLESQQVQDRLAALLKINKNELFGNDRLSQISFGNDIKSRNVIESTLNLFEELSKCTLERIPPQLLITTKDQINIVKTLLDQALALTLEHANPKGERDRIVNELQNHYPGFFMSVSPIISFSTRAGMDFKKIEHDARDSVATTKAIVEQSRNMFESKKIEVNELVSSIREAAAETGVSQNSIHYSIAKDHHANLADQWLKVAISFGILLSISTIVAVGSLMYLRGDQFFKLGYAEWGLIILFLMLSFALNFSVRQYNNHRHLEEINADKSRALATFLAFANATEDDSVKSVLLQQSSSAIFTPSQTGYLKGQTIFGPPAIEISNRLAEKIWKQPPGNA
jgi:hypothetical protein